ncbi:MAG: Ig-like domain-containing protein [Gammaproteobacteria bacterium]|nr:Ig-like domain-containing protein [Gammaproteobacteria bacterium]
MAYAASTGNNTWEVPRYGDPSNTLIDGLAGTDRLSFERLPRSRFLITQNADTGYIHIDSVSGASSTYHLRLKDVEFALFNSGRDVVDLTAMFKDVKAPTITTFNMHSFASGAPVDTSLVFGLSENIARGTTSVTLSKIDGTLIETFNMATSSKVSTSTTQLTINPTANLAYGTTYTIALSTGAVADTAGNALAAVSYNFNTVANNAPVVGNAQLAATEDTSVSGAVPTATDADGQSVTYAVAEGPAHGTITLTADGKFVYTPLTNYSGADKFTFTASDGVATSAPGQVVITIAPVQDRITGTAGNDVLTGNIDSDIFTGGAGNDVISGGEGIDIATYVGTRANFQVTKQNSQLTVADSTGALGTDTLSTVERLTFTDQALAFDIDGNAGMAAKLLGAIAGKTAAANKEYVGIALDLLDKGMSPADIATLALNVVLGGKTTSTAVVGLIYQNLTSVAPDTATLNQYAGMLDRGELTSGQLGVLAADVSLNLTNIDIVGLAQTGIGYIPVV